MENQSDSPKKGCINSGKTTTIIAIVILLYFIGKIGDCNNASSDNVEMNQINLTGEYKGVLAGNQGQIEYFLTINGDDTYTVRKNFYDGIGGGVSEEQFSGEIKRNNLKQKDAFGDGYWIHWKVSSWGGFNDPCLVFHKPETQEVIIDKIELDPSCAPEVKYGKVISFYKR